MSVRDSSKQQLGQIFMDYKNMLGNDIEKTIKKFSGAVKAGFLAIVKIAAYPMWTNLEDNQVCLWQQIWQDLGILVQWLYLWRLQASSIDHYCNVKISTKLFDVLKTSSYNLGWS